MKRRHPTRFLKRALAFAALERLMCTLRRPLPRCAPRGPDSLIDQREEPMRHIVSAMLLVVALTHLLPLAGVLGATRLEALYGVQLDDSNLAILMRHRAVLFGLLGALLALAAFQPTLQATAFVAGGASVLSFLYLAWAVGGYNAQIARVVVADVVAAICLIVGAIAYVLAHRQT